MQNKIFKVLLIRPFVFLLLAEIFSQLAVNMLNFVLIIVAYTLTNSSTAVSGVIITFTVPALLFGLLAGVYVDKWNKKRVLYITNLLRALLVFLLIFTHSNLVLIYILSFVISFISQFFVPAETPMIPVVVKKKELLLSANAIFGVIIYASIFIAYALSGPLFLIIGKTGIFITLSLCFLLAAFFASLIDVKLKSKNIPEIKELKVNIVEEMKKAYAFFRKAKVIYRALFLLTLAQILVLSLAVIGPAYSREILKIDVERFPFYFVTPAIIGTALAAVIVGSYFHKHPKHLITQAGLLLMGFSILALPYGSKVESRAIVQTLNYYLPKALDINVLHILVVLAFILGISNALIFVPSNTILQEETSEEFRGKVYGALNTMVGLFSILPTLIVGGLADLIGIKAVISGIGIIVLGIGIISVVTSRKN